MDLQVITAGAEKTGGIPAEKELIAFADAVLGHDTAAIASARSQLRQVCGIEGLVDAAAVVANFQRMVIIADGTGIALDKPLAMVTAGLRDKLGINSFGSAANTPAVNFAQRMLGSMLGKFLPLLFRRMAKATD